MKKIILIIFIITLVLSGCSTQTISEKTNKNTLINKASFKDPFDNAPIKKITIRAFRFQFVPNMIKVDEGDHVKLTISSMDVGHGFAIPEYGINQKIPAQKSVTIDFLANISGKFNFFSSVYSGRGYKNMTGELIVNPIMNK